MSHARKYRYIETNAAKDTLTKFGKSDKTPDPYTPEQVKALMVRVEGTVWEMPVILGGLYGMRRSEILGLRWRNVDLENNTFDVTEQLPFKVPPKTKVIEEMAPPKSNGRKLPITELARPFFLKQFAMQEAQREQAEKDGKPCVVFFLFSDYLFKDVGGIFRNSDSIMAIVMTTRTASVKAIASQTPRTPIPPIIGRMIARGIKRMI